MAIKLIDYGSPEYKQMLHLRYQILRQPLGLEFDSVQLAGEKEDILIGAFDEEDLLACCILTPEDSQTIRLRQMAVQNNLQGKGIGATMMGFAENVARDRGFTRMTMHARKSATGFYEKLGYEICSDEFEEVTIPHYIMEKPLINF